MPTYSYQCKECSKTFTEVRSMSEEPKINSCTECKKPVQRLYEVRGVNFRGNGFYSTDKRTVIETPMGDFY
jgi:putative FmdB family regulatory protein